MQSYREMHHSILPMFPPQTGQCQASSRACAVLCLVAQSCSTLCDSMDYSPSSSSVHGDSPGKNTRVGCHALLQGICPTQGSNPGLPHCRWILYHLSHIIQLKSFKDHSGWDWEKRRAFKRKEGTEGRENFLQPKTLFPSFSGAGGKRGQGW